MSNLNYAIIPKRGRLFYSPRKWINHTTCLKYTVKHNIHDINLNCNANLNWMCNLINIFTRIHFIMERFDPTHNIRRFIHDVGVFVPKPFLERCFSQTRIFFPKCWKSKLYKICYNIIAIFFIWERVFGWNEDEMLAFAHFVLYDNHDIFYRPIKLLPKNCQHNQGMAPI